MQFSTEVKMARILVMQDCISYAVTYAQFNKIERTNENELQV